MKGAVLFVAACAAVLSGCGSTSGKPRLGITLDRRIGSVREGESKSAVDAVLGHGAEKTFVVYAQAKLRVGFYTGQGHQFAIEIDTQAPQYRTSSGIGVGSTLAQLRRRIHDLSCDPIASLRCHHPSASTNDTNTATLFKIDPATKRVTEVDIMPVD